jgi:hypothetical protein
VGVQDPERDREALVGRDVDVSLEQADDEIERVEASTILGGGRRRRGACLVVCAAFLIMLCGGDAGGDVPPRETPLEH